MENRPLVPVIAAVLKASRRIHAVLDDPMEKQLGLSYTEISLLRLLDEGAETPSDLARELALPAPTVSRILNHLSDRGLVERTLDPENLRRVRLSLTQEGRKTRTKTRQAATQLIEAYFGDIPEEVLSQALNALSTLEPYLREAQYA